MATASQEVRVGRACAERSRPAMIDAAGVIFWGSNRVRDEAPRAWIYWQDFDVGGRYETFGRTIAAHDITTFCNTVGIVEPLFTDTEYRRQHSAMNGFVAPAALVFAVADGLVLAGTGHGTGLAFLHTELDIKAPVLAGDTINVRLEVIDVRASSRGRGLVRTRNEVVNQHGVVVLIYTPLRLMAGQPSED